MITKEDERAIAVGASRLFLARRLDRVRFLLEAATKSSSASADLYADELREVYGIKLPPRTAYR